MAIITNKTLLTNDVILGLRSKLASIAAAFNAHIGSSGDTEHVAVNTVRNGFIYPEQYEVLKETLPTLVDQVYQIMKDSELAPGTLLWFCGHPKDIPDGWELADARECLPMYPISIPGDGATLKGIEDQTGTVGLLTGTKGKKQTVETTKTIALYLIRKRYSDDIEDAIEEEYNDNRISGSEDINGMTYFPTEDIVRSLEHIQFGTYRLPRRDINAVGETTYTFSKPEGVQVLKIIVGKNIYYFQVKSHAEEITLTRSYEANRGTISITCDGNTHNLYDVITMASDNSKLMANIGLVRIDWSIEINRKDRYSTGSLESISEENNV